MKSAKGCNQGSKFEVPKGDAHRIARARLPITTALLSLHCHCSVAALSLLCRSSFAARAMNVDVKAAPIILKVATGTRWVSTLRSVGSFSLLSLGFSRPSLGFSLLSLGFSLFSKRQEPHGYRHCALLVVCRICESAFRFCRSAFRVRLSVFRFCRWGFRFLAKKV